MKKLVVGVAIMIGFTSMLTAQTTAPVQASKPVVKAAYAKPVKPAVVTAHKTDKNIPITKAVTAAPVVKPAAAVNAQAVVLKKDGTPDKRYKNAPATVPLKKDGTPDKRFKTGKKSQG